MIIDAINAQNFEELFAIHSPEFNLGLLDIAELVPEGIEQYLIKNFDKIPTHYKCFISKEFFEESLKQVDDLYYVLDDGEEKTQLINFIKTLVSNFADITDAPELGLSLEKVKNDLCKHFHCDMNHLRLVYPLIGPGTLWTKEDNLRREFLGKGQNEKVIIDKTQIFQVPKNTITLLKGQGHPSAHGKAVVHASPQITHTQEKRILLRIESIF